MERAFFLSRPNRFVALVEPEGRRGDVVVCHVKNTGRCRELLIPGTPVYIQRAGNLNRKTAYDLIVVEKNGVFVNMDSQAPNVVAEEWLRTGCLFSRDARIRREVKHGTSRFDLYVEDGDRRAFMEVKGVTLEEDGTALFPDAPTERGIKHIQELEACRQSGYEAYLLFVIQMKGVTCLRPNDRTHPAFGDALRSAARSGVQILAADCLVRVDSLCLDQMIPVILN